MNKELSDFEDCKIKIKGNQITNKYLELILASKKDLHIYIDSLPNRPIDELICLSILDVMQNNGMKISEKNGQIEIKFCNKFKIPAYETIN